ncbi:orotidine 5'-phosphate decarboxylase [Polycladomyces abyssicola]|uniref:Orotidine 5'-phosphate decarboxylase n=1 Tax=Polycladomyces abyssicola TaxID=1125966 RepID=A0A8D5UGW6_9BACL|nr:orotidine-5'-phosphate decarboxylase [Polycladomyces abyssicola]BCU82221.1 orotidine 5'-phosphate decarboxylase [Polycladomyces abyssicola]
MTSSTAQTDPTIIIALDLPTQDAAESFLAGFPWEKRPFLKVGMQLFYATGPTWVASLKERGYPVFLDLKLHDIPHTVYHAVKSVANLGVDMLTLHAGGGVSMMAAAREAAEVAGADTMRLVGVTQLTSNDQRTMNEEIGIPGTVEDCVRRYAGLVAQAGLHGIVCSGWEVPMVKQAMREAGTEGIAVVPGIRPQGVASDDQKRVMTPEQAIQNGADYLVMGRAILRADDPVRVYEQIQQDITKVRRI